MTRQEEARIPFEKWAAREFSKHEKITLSEALEMEDNEYCNDIVQGLWCAYFAGYWHEK